MARKKIAPHKAMARKRLAARLKEIRAELYGEDGGADVARLLKIPVETWRKYEAGSVVPAEVILRLIALTLVDPKWLLFGLGDKYRTHAPGDVADRAPKGGARLVVDLLNNVSDRLEDGHLVINVSWKKSR
jgi:hypothetical protein